MATWKSPYKSVPVSKISLDQKLMTAMIHHMDVHPNKPALICGEDPNSRITYKEIYVYSLAAGTFLSQRGFRKHVMCLVLPNSFEYVVGYLAANMCGGAISGASAMFTDYELERQFLDSGCTVVLTDDANLAKVRRAVEKCPLIKTIICTRKDKKERLPSNVFDYDEVIRTSPSTIPQTDRSVEDVAILPYSSGTTGSPKGVMLSHRNFGTMIDVVNTHFEEILLKKLPEFNWYKEHVMLMLPFYHIYGFGNLNQCLLNGSTGVVFSKFDPNHFLRAIQSYKVKILMLVPPIVLFLAKHPLTTQYDLSSIQIVITGAAPCGKELCEEFYSKYKNVKYMAQAYGMTECGMASHLPILDDKQNYVTVGYAASNFEQKIIDPATGKTLNQGERGEICVRGPTVMKGYLNRKAATEETIDKEGWLHTGDIGYVDQKGQTFIVDRLKELIKVKGLQVPPAELEDLLLSHPSIKDAAVIGIPDGRTGEKPKAFVVRSDPRLTEREVQKFVESKVSSYKYLTGGVEFIEEIPKSAAGKILRRFLRDRKSKI
ncbi:unnamed protein product [Auanema sp. JU1783]|nr:unnamed protein product [Auanema sp. JU1783]